jgi:peptidoglycan-N-acetylglucosamine deacetylase
VGIGDVRTSWEASVRPDVSSVHPRSRRRRHAVVLVLTFVVASALVPVATPAQAQERGELRTVCPTPLSGMIRHHPGPSRSVALTFDDGPHATWTPQVLDLLAEHGVRATFFVVGARGEQHPDLLRRVVADGHVIANHTQTHPTGDRNFDELPRADRVREMEVASAVIDGATSVRPCFFRGPGGRHDTTLTRQLANERGMTVTDWSMSASDAFQPVEPDEAWVRDTVHRLTSPSPTRGVLLFHDGGPASAYRGNTLPTVHRTIVELKRQGFGFVDPLGRPFPTLDRSVARACPPAVRFSTGFRDVPAEHPHLHAILCAARRGVIEGRTATTFAPGSALTRGQAASMLHRSLTANGIDPGAAGAVGFSDLGTSPHRRNVEQLAATGIIEGRTDGTFRPSDPIRREQMASMLVRLLELGYGHAPEVGPSFRDVDPDSVHATNIRKLVGAGVTRGVSADRFDPSAQVIRAQMATFVMRAEDVLVRSGRTEVPASVQ